MANILSLILRNPIRTTSFSYTFIVQILLIILKRILLPHYPHYQSLRLQLQRAYLSSSSLCFPDFVHRLPITYCSEKRARKVGDSWTGYVVPGTRELKDTIIQTGDIQRGVVVYAHGGGYARGEARMYLNYMERWVKVAKQAGLELTFLTVEYPLSTKESHPAQLDSFLKAYQYLLDGGIPAQRIVFAGDSAGGGLSLLSGIELIRRDKPQPAASVLISPWINMSLQPYKAGNALIETDYVVTANTMVPALTSMWIGAREGTSTEINPLYCKPEELHGLNPQLILAGAGEFVVQDSRDLAELCEKANVKYEFVEEWGQLHIYAMGSKWIAPMVREKTDARIINWIKQNLDKQDIKT